MICRSCGQTFNLKDAPYGYREHCGIKIQGRVCPNCKSGTFRSVEVSEEFDKYLFCDSDSRYYSYSDNGGN